ncbi:sensor histidine kinase [Herpetosiphon giganteus]|uniref:sensor histidine kinase n=1 Tax=Herpetosiphon giganteus TaxID=2029754 RepID=UPI00195EC94F|nr:ATP-binding protein [Herpetosiphon giganteus]MBM7843383.1 signal transduction histidine kinase [Herpetosiphon giganteus]
MKRQTINQSINQLYRIATILIIVVIYLLTFPWLYRLVGGTIGAFVLIPIGLVAWSFGWRRGLAATVIGLSITLWMLRWAGMEWVQLRALWPPALMSGLMIGMIGWLRSLLTTIQAQTGELERERELLANEISQRKQIEQSLLAAKEDAELANHTKSQFLAMMSHELRTPLNAIIGYSELLQEDAAAEQLTSYEQDLKVIHNAGVHLLGLINDMLDLAKIEAGRMELFGQDFHVHELIDDLVLYCQPQIAKNNNRLVLDIAENVGLMHSDVQKLRQILLNLLSNAAKFTQQGTITLRAKRDGDWLHFEIADSGIGMSSEQVANLFQPFVQAEQSTAARYGGTGLGLAISRSLAKLLGGDVMVESIQGQGSCFQLIVPAFQLAPVTAM